MFTIDASVWVNGFDQREDGNATSHRLLTMIRDQGLPVFAPTLLLVEVAGAISRTRNDPDQASRFASALRKLPNLTLVSLDDHLTTRAFALAANHGLRVADAVYAAVALRTNSVLVSLDKEHLTRLDGIAVILICCLAPATSLISTPISRPSADPLTPLGIMA